MPRYLVTITETNTRTAIVSAASEQEARERADQVWDDPEAGYDAFHDDQDIGHHVSDCVADPTADDIANYPDLDEYFPVITDEERSNGPKQTRV